MVAAVARLEPQIAPKPPQATMVDMARPPRRWPSTACAAAYSSRDMRDWVTKLPIRMNSGNTDSRYWNPLS